MEETTPVKYQMIMEMQIFLNLFKYKSDHLQIMSISI